MNQRNECLINQKTLDKFYAEEKFKDVDELVVEKRYLSETKSMYARNFFNAMGDKLKNIYERQFKHVQRLELKFKEKYGA